MFCSPKTILEWNPMNAQPPSESVPLVVARQIPGADRLQSPEQNPGQASGSERPHSVSGAPLWGSIQGGAVEEQFWSSVREKCVCCKATQDNSKAFLTGARNHVIVFQYCKPQGSLTRSGPGLCLDLDKYLEGSLAQNGAPGEKVGFGSPVWGWSHRGIWETWP